MASRYHSIAPTMPGFHPGYTHAVNIDIAEHCNILSEFMEQRVKQIQKSQKIRTIIVVGFSLGADLAFNILRQAKWKEQLEIGLLALDCNLSNDTCFISRELAEMKVSNPVKALMNIAAHATRTKQGKQAERGKLGKWLAIHEYLVKVFKKFESNLLPLKVLAGELADLFKDEEPTMFLDNCRALSEAGIAVRCVFSGSDANKEALSRSAVPGQSKVRSRGKLHIESQTNAGHFDLIEEPTRLAGYVKDVIEMVRSKD